MQYTNIRNKIHKTTDLPAVVYYGIELILLIIVKKIFEDI
jgi:hypothetical protein